MYTMCPNCILIITYEHLNGAEAPRFINLYFRSWGPCPPNTTPPLALPSFPPYFWLLATRLRFRFFLSTDPVLIIGSGTD